MRQPNDELLAQQVQEIDLILGGHDHFYGHKQVCVCVCCCCFSFFLCFTFTLHCSCTFNSLICLFVCLFVCLINVVMFMF